MHNRPSPRHPWLRVALGLRGLWFLGFVVLLLGLLTLPAPAGAQSGRSVLIERRDGDLTIATNGDVRVVETWVVRFTGTFSQTFRSIPLNRVVDITDWEVREGNTVYRQSRSEQPNTYYLTTENNARTITWTFPATTNQTRTFALSYTLKGALRIYPGGDQLYWKFIEGDRPYDITASTVTLHLPASFVPEQLKATAYQNASERPQQARIADGQTIVFSGGPFPAGVEWEIRAQFPHGVVTATPPPWQRAADLAPILNLVALVLGILILLVGGVGLYLLWYLRGRDRPVGRIAEFYPSPPENLPPGVAGTLIDEAAGMPEIIATLVDLARRGFLRIEERAAGWLRGSPDFHFTRLPGDGSALRPYEQRLLDAIFMGDTERDLSDLRNRFYPVLTALKADLYREVVEQGFFPSNPNTVRGAYIGLGVAWLICFGILGFLAYGAIAEYAPLALFPVGAFAAVGIG